ncbi:MAG: glutathione S-transferase [Mariprofundus sp.]|nr:glutathione S-transferase [Mariprofundus sp.]
MNKEGVLPILYSFRRCPYAIRARMALYESAVDVEIREVALKAKPAELLAISVKASVPVLLLPSGVVIDESLEIMQWALRQHGSDGWLQNKQTAELIARNDHQFKYHLDRYKYPERFGSDVLALEHRAQGALFLRELDSLLRCHKFLTAAKATIADVAVFPFVRQYAAVDAVWFASLPYPQLQSWLRYWLDSELFHLVMMRYAPWSVGMRASYLFHRYDDGMTCE